MPFQHQHGEFQGPVGVWPPSYVGAHSGESVWSSQHSAVLTADTERYNRRLESYRRRHSTNVLKHENWCNASNEVERRKTAELLRRWLESNASKRTSSKAKQSSTKVEVSSAGDNNTAIIQQPKTFPVPRNKRRATANESETNRSTCRSQSECFAESIQSTVRGMPLSSTPIAALSSSTEKTTAEVPVSCSLSANFLPGTAVSQSRSDLPKYKQQALADVTQKSVVGSIGTSYDVIRGHDDRTIFDNPGGYDELGDLATFDILTFMDGSESTVDTAADSAKTNAAGSFIWYVHPNPAISSNSVMLAQSYPAMSDCGSYVKYGSKENVCRNVQHAAEKISNSANSSHHRQYGAMSNQCVERKLPTHSSVDRNRNCMPVDMPALDYISSCITGQSATQPVYSQALEMQCYDMAQGAGNAEGRPLPRQQKQLVNIGQCMNENGPLVAMPHQQMVFHQQRRNQSVSQQYWSQPRLPGQCGSSFGLLTDQQKSSICSQIDDRGYSAVKMMPDAARLNYKLMSNKVQETNFEKGHISNLVSASESSAMWSLGMESNRPVRNMPKSSAMCEPTRVAPAGTTYQSSATPLEAYYDYTPYEQNSTDWSAGDNRYSHVSPVTPTAFVPSNEQWPYCPRTMTSSGVCGSSVISQSQSSQNPHQPAVQNRNQSQSLHYPSPPTPQRVDRTRAMGVSALADLQQTYRPVGSGPMQDDDVFFSPTGGTKSSSLVRFGCDSDLAETGSFHMQHHPS